MTDDDDEQIADLIAQNKRQESALRKAWSKTAYLERKWKRLHKEYIKITRPRVQPKTLDEWERMVAEASRQLLEIEGEDG